MSTSHDHIRVWPIGVETIAFTPMVWPNSFHGFGSTICLNILKLAGLLGSYKIPCFLVPQLRKIPPQVTGPAVSDSLPSLEYETQIIIIQCSNYFYFLRG